MRSEEQTDAIERAISLGVGKSIFSRPSFGRIWQICQELYEHGMPADLESVPMLLTDEELQGGELANELASATIEAPPTQCADYLLRTMLGEAAKDFVERKSIDLVQSLKGKGNVDPEQVAEEAQNAFGELLVSNTQNSMRRTKDASELALGAFNRQLEIEQNEGSTKDEFVTTGMQRLDDELGFGFKKKSFYIVGARPGVGKTMLSMQMAIAAAQAGKRVLYFSMEMDAQELAERILSRLSAVDGRNILKSQMSPDEKGRYYEACEELKTLPLSINDSAMPHLQKVFRATATAMTSGPLDMIVIDYLQQLKSPNKHQSRVSELTEITSQIKRFSADRNIVVLGCAQLNRASDKDPEAIPKKSDLKDCGSLEQDTDGVILIHRPTVKNQYAQDTLNLDKNRRGAETILPVWVDARIGLVTTRKPRI